MKTLKITVAVAALSLSLCAVADSPTQVFLITNHTSSPLTYNSGSTCGSTVPQPIPVNGTSAIPLTCTMIAYNGATPVAPYFSFALSQPMHAWQGNCSSRPSQNSAACIGVSSQSNLTVTLDGVQVPANNVFQSVSASPNPHIVIINSNS